MALMSETGAEPSLKQALDYAPPAETPAAPPSLKPVELKKRRVIPWKWIGGIVLIVGLGIGSGWGLAQRYGGGVAGIKSPEEAAQTGLKVGDVVGSADASAFKDTATGVLDRGGIDGEGSHRLLREGGESQTVYVTSSVMDLDQFVEHKVQAWGETFAAQKAGWLMDVGRVKVLELNAPPPF